MLQTLVDHTKIVGIGHVVLQVADVSAAQVFYCDVLGLRPCAGTWPRAGGGLALATDRGDLVILAAGPLRGDTDVSAAHVGYAISPAGHARALDAVARHGGEVYLYREDRPVEASNNVYVYDPSGNRVQLIKDVLVSGYGADRIDHVAIEVNDILGAELTLSELFGSDAVYRVGWTTDDYLKAKAAGANGMRDAMPGSRYWNERYSPFEAERRTLRPCPQLYYAAGDATLVVYLATRRFQASPDNLVVGSPRVGLVTDEGGLETLADLLRSRDLTFQGPFRHDQSRRDGPSPTASVYFRDLSGNFIEFFAPARRA